MGYDGSQRVSGRTTDGQAKPSSALAGIGSDRCIAGRLLVAAPGREPIPDCAGVAECTLHRNDANRRGAN
ncbi:hypothetical protein Pflav_009080 [Phytohabitans flavus]|uniref:Uncharacterized protein n=1 Tax=Phytohabitans flavus TaxID=1076124 RepID=A0A6F8XL26_9ACTN|nr:hypothetical protein Pflav_009080 [Phytohabitans flavus]